MFEEGEPPKREPIERPQERKERLKKEKLVNHLIQQEEEAKKCKYCLLW